MAPRATWKGVLRLGELGCAVSLHAAVSTSDRVSFRTVDVETGHAVRRRFVDEETGDVVEREDQVKGYDTGTGDPVLIEPEDMAATQPEGDKTLAIAGFLPCDAVDPVFFDRPYFLAPAADASAPAFALIRDALAEKSMTALADAVLFRRARKLLLRAYEDGMIATTLHFDYEVRAEEETFGAIKDQKVDREMLDLATHIIATKRGSVDVTAFEDRYEAAVVDLVRRKLAGKPIRKPKAAPRGTVVSLMDALRESAGKKAPVDNADQEPAKGKKASSAAASEAKAAPKASKSPRTKAAAAKTGTGKAGTGKTAAKPAAGRTAPRRKAG